MKVCKHLFLAIALCLAVTAGSVPSHAADNHPFYLHALSDLRMMRAYLDRQSPDERLDDDAARAIQEIDEAIRQIKGAAIDDNRDLNEHPAIDAHLRRADRYRRALELGNAAWHDLDHEEDDPNARVMKFRAIDRVKKADDIVRGMAARADRDNR